MLDQNTDRMWYVIGAVIVGAAIILIMNGVFPGLFGSVSDIFAGKATEASTHLMYDGSNMLTYDEMDVTREYGGKLTAFDDDTGVWTIEIPPNASQWSNGLSAGYKAAVVPFGMAYSLSYDVWSPIDTYSKNDIDTFALDGSNWKANDNDDMTKRKQSDTAVKAGVWTTQWITIYNTNPLNTKQIPIYDGSDFGVINPSSSTIHIKIRNVKGELGESPTPYRIGH